MRYGFHNLLRKFPLGLTAADNTHWLKRWLLTLLLCSVCGFSAAEKSTTVTYYHTDILGSVVAASDEEGNILWRRVYQPYGETHQPDPNDTEDIGYTGKERDASGLVYFGARYYDPIAGRFMGIDPMGFVEGNPQSFNRYAYANNNPYAYVDPDGNSPVSIFVKQVAKHGAKKGLKNFGEKRIKRRLSRYMNKSQSNEFAQDLSDILDTLNSSWVDIAIELTPGVGDIYGGAKFAKQLKDAYGKLQDLENKWVQKIIDSKSPEERKKFITSMRNAGVRDAKKDQGIAKTGSGLEGHHKTWVSQDPSKASDPRNIEFLSPSDHQAKHK